MHINFYKLYIDGILTADEELSYLKLNQKCADLNLNLLSTIIELEQNEQIKLTPGLIEMIECTLEYNWEQYRKTKEKLNNYGNVL